MCVCVCLNLSILNSVPLTCHSATGNAANTAKHPPRAVQVCGKLCIFNCVYQASDQDMACKEIGCKITTRRSIFYFIKPPSTSTQTHDSHTLVSSPLPSHNLDCFLLKEQESRQTPSSRQSPVTLQPAVSLHPFYSLKLNKLERIMCHEPANMHVLKLSIALSCSNPDLEFTH